MRNSVISIIGMMVAVVLLADNVYAACSSTTTRPSGSTYSDYTILADFVIGTPPYGDASCATSATRWYIDSTRKEYQKVTYCTSCSSSYSLTNIAAVVGSCVIDVPVCSTCTVQTTKPSGALQNGPSVGGNCSSYTTKYVVSGTATTSMQFQTCTACSSGSHMITKSTTLGVCHYSYLDCEVCPAGTYYNKAKQAVNTKCDACPDGTYSSTTEATSCGSCPSASSPAQYTTPDMTAVASYSNGKIAQDGHTSANQCYLTAGTYYDAAGTYTTPSCYYNDTVRESTMDCSVTHGVCTNAAGTSGTVYNIAPYGSMGTGQACWCGYGEGSYTTGYAKWLFIGTMGPSASGESGSCATTCTDEFCQTQVNQISAYQSLLGCD